MHTTIGLEVLLEAPEKFVFGKRVGLVAGASSVDSQLISSPERLYRHPHIDLRALFGPEHGLRGEAQAGAYVQSYDDPVTGLPVYSLYGKTQKPTAEMLENLDMILFDLQDGGVRFYTYLSTLASVMQAAAAHALPVLILDRPVFLGGEIMEGGLLDPEYASFVGLYPLPIRYGMTAGEIASLLNQEFSIGCELRVIPMRNWHRGMWFDQTGLPFVPPSPNLPTLSAVQLYPGTCLIEGTNLSEGRGTTRPFEYIGAPWIHAEQLARDLNALNLEGVRFRPVYFVPTFSKYQGEHCAGVHLYVTDRQRFRPVQSVLLMIEFIKAAYPDQFGWKEPWSAGSKLPIDLLSGSARLRHAIDEGRSMRDLLAQWDASLVSFQGIREQYLLYR